MSFLSSVANTAKKQAENGLNNLKQGLLSQMKGQLSSWGISAPLGSLGDVVFEVSNRKVFTFDGYKRTTKARYASHEIIGQPPILEFLGPDGEEITFVMQFRVDCGVNPAAESDKIREMCKTGETNYFLLGSTVIGEHKWAIMDVGEDNATIDNMGRIIQNKISVTLKEYVEEVE